MGYISSFTPARVRKGTDWGKRPCFVCGHNTTKTPAAWTPPLICHRPAFAATGHVEATHHRLCSKCRTWITPDGRFKMPGAPAESLAARCEFEVAPPGTNIVYYRD